MAAICITGSSDGIGLATARVLVASGHRVVVHARTRERGRPVLEEGGQATLVTGDLARPDEVHRLADQIRENGPIDTLVHNAGVWVRGNTPPTTVDGLETTFAVNVLAAHLLTSLLADDLQDRLIWLGSGRAEHGRADPAATLGEPQDRSQAYSDSKACDVALALAWGRRLPKVASAAVDPGWVRTKLASAGAPGVVTSSADTLAYCCTQAHLSSSPYWKDRQPTPVPQHLLDETLQDALAAACDRLAGIESRRDHRPPRDTPTA